MLVKTFLLGGFLISAHATNAQVRAVQKPGTDEKNPVRSSAIDAGDYIYISGQGPQRDDGAVPADFEAQASQSLENIKSILSADGLNLENVVYVQVYLEDVNNYDRLNSVFAKYFSAAPPARAVLGVAKVPQGSIEITAVAVRDLEERKVVTPANYNSTEPFSPGILTRDRLFVSAMPGRDPQSGVVPDDPAAQTDLALDGVKAVVEAAGLKLANMVFVNPYLTEKIPMKVMNEHYAQRFEFGNTPARATIEVAALPHNAQIEYTGVAVRDLSLRHSIRPRNMPPSPTASPCVFAGDTLYCSAKSGFIPGPHGGVYGATTAAQLRQTMRNQLDNLEEAEMDFSQVVYTTVYLDDLADSDAFHKVYAQYFKPPLPAETLLQQIPSGKRTPDDQGHYPDLEQMSFIAIRPRKK
ncbi:MAG: Rid family hydrolase [Acidobacteriota bacterium]|nr:Rid family hydrolase [Acidobacteriota bacterium]